MKKWHRVSALLTLALSLLPFWSSAEVVWAKLFWKPDFCPAGCYPLMERRLRGIDCISRVDFNFAEGTAKLVWKPNQPYDDRKLRTPMAWVGVHISDVHLKVRGVIESDDKDLFIVSLGDGTRMPLLSPAKLEEGRYLMNPTRSAYSLDPATKERLLQAQKNHEIVTLEGKVIMPYRPPIHLLIENADYHTVE